MTEWSAQGAELWLRRGRQWEALGGEGELAEAVQCYDRAIAALHRAGPGGAAHARELGVAWMNRGNGLRKLAAPAQLAEAVRAYDEAIALLRTLPPAADADDCNRLGAAWMNRGLTLHRQGEAAEAVRSQREAVAVLRIPSLDGHPWLRRNLAAAWMNLANALLDSREAERAALARAAAKEALALTGPQEETDVLAAEIGLKARRALCDAIGGLLGGEAAAGPAAELAAEAADAVDEGLARAGRWEARDGGRELRTAAARLFHFGAQLCRIHQPHFLAEFLLEHLEGEGPPDASRLAVAADALAQALRALRAAPGPFVAGTATDRQLETWRALHAAAARVALLRGKPAS